MAKVTILLETKTRDELKAVLGYAKALKGTGIRSVEFMLTLEDRY